MEVNGDIDPLELGGMDSLECRAEVVLAEGEEEIDLGPQLGGPVCDLVPALPDETQVHNPSIEDLRVRGGVRLEDIHQNLDGELVDRGGARGRTSGGGLRHVF